MSIELITGRAGKPHVDSQDVRAYQAYTAGSGRYVLHGAACSVESANQVSIAPGEILVDGAHVRVTGDGETVTLANGQTGYKRADIVALHYMVTGSGESIVESMEFAVVQGSPSDADPEDPDMPQSGSILDGVTETYIPYARVTIDGLSPQDPVMLVEQYALPSGMGGIPSGGDLGSFLSKASATDYDTGWKTADETLADLGVGELLWDGEFKSGSITVPGINDYAVLLVKIAGSYNTGQLAMLYVSEVLSTGARSVTGGYNALGEGGQVSTLGYGLNINPDTDELTAPYTYAGYLYFAEGRTKYWHGISKIYGLIKRVGDIS